MGLLGKLFGNNASSEEKKPTLISAPVKNTNSAYADASSIVPDERPYYQPDVYYTLYKPGIPKPIRVIPFEERKKISYPSKRGLYVAEITRWKQCCSRGFCR